MYILLFYIIIWGIHCNQHPLYYVCTTNYQQVYLAVSNYILPRFSLMFDYNQYITIFNKLCMRYYENGETYQGIMISLYPIYTEYSHVVNKNILYNRHSGYANMPEIRTLCPSPDDVLTTGIHCTYKHTVSV